MEEEITYKVLWIDDDETIVDSMVSFADFYGIEIVHFTNWQDGYTYLEKEIKTISAIILDAFCKPTPDSIEDANFIYHVFPKLFALPSEKHVTIPWYILSAGTMSSFDQVIEVASAARKEYEPEWGPLLYIKAKDENDLFENIRTVAQNQINNISIFRHKDVFQYIGEGRQINNEVRSSLLKMLGALYNPEDNTKFEYKGNPIRIAMEYIFRSAHAFGLIPDEVFDPYGGIRITEARNFIYGKEIKAWNQDHSTELYRVRWVNDINKITEKDESYVPKNIQKSIKLILDYSNPESHSKKINPEEDECFKVDDYNKEYFFSHVMLLCHVIKWYGHYIKHHSNKKENILHIIKIKDTNTTDTQKERKVETPKTPENYLNKRFLFTNGISERCKLDESIEPRNGVFKVIDVKENQDSDKDKYQFVVTQVE